VRFIISLILLIVFFFIFSDKAISDTETEKMVEYVKPSVVQIYMDIEGIVAYPIPVINKQAYQMLIDELSQLANSGAFGNDPEKAQRLAVSYILSKMAKNPNAFLIPTKRIKQVPLRTGAVGSGVIINPNGYILTATHCVAMDEEELKSIVIQNFLSKLVQEEVQAMVLTIEQEAGVQLSEDEEKLCAQIIIGYVASNIKEFKYDLKIYAGLGVAERGRSNVGTFFKPATVVKVGAVGKISDIVDLGRDIAIIKIDELNLPTSLISDQEPSPGSDVIVVGYPAAVHLFLGQFFDNFTMSKPTITKGVASDVRVSHRGTRIIQVDAATSGGNSGGPAYNKDGKIIGTVSWGHKEKESYNFLVSCKEIENLLREANVQNVQSAVDENYKKGIDEYFDQHYRNAMRYFKKVQEIYPDHPYVKDYIARCQEAIDQGKDRSGISFDNTTAIIFIGIGLLLCGAFFIAALGLVAYFVFFRKFPKKA